MAIKTSSKEKKAAQLRRTANNKVKKYEKLLKENPNNPHRKNWEKQLEFFLERI